jgi:hypothetical protein
MLNIPGRPGRTCEGPTRRELMRIGSLGLAGLHLPGFFLSQKAAQANNIADRSRMLPTTSVASSNRLRPRSRAPTLANTCR